MLCAFHSRRPVHTATSTILLLLKVLQLRIQYILRRRRGFLKDWVAGIWILASFERLQYPRSVELGKFALRCNLSIQLSPNAQQVQKSGSSHEGVSCLLRHFVRSLCVICTCKRVQCEVLDVRFGCHIIDNGVIRGIFGLVLLQFVHELQGVGLTFCI
jgi:hypothetical protein